MNFAPSFLLVLALLLAAAHPGADAKALASVSDKSYAATASGVNGATITKIEIYADTSLIGTSNAAPASTTWYAIIPGVYTLTAKAYDSQGATATSAPITVTITAAPGETITFLHNDLAGNPIAATDVNGAIVWRESYSPYGDRQKIQAASSANRQWFGGKPLDSETGLSYYGARYYDPFIGRFMGIDAAGFSEKNLHSFNRYAYGNNNPYRFVDPDGNSASDIFEGTNYGSGPVDIPNFLTPAGEVAMGAVASVASLIPAVRLAQMVGKFFGAGKAEKDPGKDSGVESTKELTKQEAKSIRSYEKNIAEHQEKIDAFKQNPTIRPGMEGMSKEAIQAQQAKRIQHLEGEIQTFRNNIEKIFKGE